MKTLIARSPFAGTSSFTGSLRTSAFAGIDTAGRPLKVSARSEPATISGPLDRNATWAGPISTACLP